MTYFDRLVWSICNMLKLLSNIPASLMTAKVKYQVFRFINSQLKINYCINGLYTSSFPRAFDITIWNSSRQVELFNFNFLVFESQNIYIEKGATGPKRYNKRENKTLPRQHSKGTEGGKTPNSLYQGKTI